jgi:hypothetical protein
LSVEGAVGSVVVVVVLPFGEAFVEDVGVVDDDAVEEGVELFGVDAVGAFYFAVESWGGGFDVDAADTAVENVPVEL